MSEWRADITNDPFDDFNLVVEILHNDKDVAIIKNGINGLEIKWYAMEEDITIPFEWFYELLIETKKILRSN